MTICEKMSSGLSECPSQYDHSWIKLFIVVNIQVFGHEGYTLNRLWGVIRNGLVLLGVFYSYSFCTTNPQSSNNEYCIA